MLFTWYLCVSGYVFIFMVQTYAQPELFELSKLSERLWNENIFTAEAVYKSGFIQGIKENNLDEEIFRKKF